MFNVNVTTTFIIIKTLDPVDQDLHRVFVLTLLFPVNLMGVKEHCMIVYINITGNIRAAAACDSRKAHSQTQATPPPLPQDRLHRRVRWR